MKRITRYAALLLLVVLCLSLAACNSGGDKIVGTWAEKIDDVVITTYEFTKQGEFVVSLIRKGEITEEIIGTYKVKGNELTMIYDNTPDNKRVRTYKIKGDKLTITDPEEGPFEYSREK